MKYTIPYDDKITLPHIKQIESVEINTDNLNYDKRELTGEVIITGDYLLDNSSDIMEFKHDIPVSFLIDDAECDPQITITNFKYELIPGRGLEVIFDLDVTLKEAEKEVEETPIEIPRDDIEEVDSEADEDIIAFQEEVDENLDKALNIRSEEEDVPIPVLDETEIVEAEVEIEPEPESFSTKLEAMLSSFDTSFVPRDNDKFTTYKILLLEKHETIDELLEARNLSKALICKEYQFDDEKIVLKLEDD